MVYRIVPRTEYGLPAKVTSADGTLRPPLSNERWITAHYTGNNVDYTSKVTADVVRQIQQVFGKTKPFEYNYVIGQEDNDEIYEFAGKFQAAHSAGENGDSFGVLFLLGVGEAPTPRMIDKWKWLRDVLIADGSLAANVDQRMHKDMPGAATACPGGIVPFWPLFLSPWVPPEQPTIPTTPIEIEEEEIMVAMIVVPPAEAGVNPPWLLHVNGSTTYCGSAAYTQAVAKGIPIVPHNLDQYSHYRKAAGL